MEINKNDAARRKWVVRFQLGIDGLRTVVYRFPRLLALKSVAVRTGDHFVQHPDGSVEYKKTTSATPGDVYAAFAEFHLEGMAKPIVYVAGEYELNRSKRCAATKEFWEKHPEEMSRRVPILLGAKDLPKGDSWAETEAIRETERIEFEEVESSETAYTHESAPGTRFQPDALAPPAPNPLEELHNSFFGRIREAEAVGLVALTKEEKTELVPKLRACETTEAMEEAFRDFTRVGLPPVTPPQND